VGRLIYSAICSLDGYVADEDDNFDWAFPGEQVHAFINDLQRPIGTHLYGHRLYEVMAAWETMHTQPDQNATALDFAATWQAADKIVYSTTLEAVSTANTRLERQFDAESIRALKATTERDISLGGPNLAAHALAAGLVDEVSLFLVPVIVGGGNPALPAGLRLPLELIEEQRFENGFVYLRYRPTT